jgi:hypothetical protein
MSVDILYNIQIFYYQFVCYDTKCLLIIYNIQIVYFFSEDRKPSCPFYTIYLRHCLCRKKTSELEKLRTFRTLFWQKVGTWVLLSSMRVTKKVPSSRSKNIRPKTLDLKSPLPITTITMDTAYQGPRSDAKLMPSCRRRRQAGRRRSADAATATAAALPPLPPCCRQCFAVALPPLPTSPREKNWIFIAPNFFVQ